MKITTLQPAKLDKPGLYRVGSARVHTDYVADSKEYLRDSLRVERQMLTRGESPAPEHATKRVSAKGGVVYVLPPFDSARVARWSSDEDEAMFQLNDRLVAVGFPELLSMTALRTQENAFDENWQKAESIDIDDGIG